MENLTKLEQQLKQYKQFILLQSLQSIQNQQQKIAFLQFLTQNIQTIQLAHNVSLHHQLYQNVYLKSKVQKKNFNYQKIQQKFTLDQINLEKSSLQKIGFDAISKKQVALLIMAGGQGSRLGFDKPKGFYKIGLQSDKTLFRIFGQRICSLQRLIKRRMQINSEDFLIPWFVMTNQQSQKQIKEYFESQNYFGLKKEQVFIFSQGMYPAVDFQGNVYLQNEKKLFMSPNGNGGMYEAMNDAGLLGEEFSYVKYIYIIGVDNILIKLCDPLCIGLHIRNNVQITSKYLKKKNPQQKIGIHVLKEGKPNIWQYSQMSKEASQMRDENGQLVYNEGYIATFIINVQFIKELVSKDLGQLFKETAHIALKKIPYYNFQQKSYVKPIQVNGIKFQLFNIDAFHFTNKIQLMEICRQEEFAPVKNKDGEDSAQTALELMSNLHRSWIQKYGVKLEQGESNLCEVDITLTYNGQDLEEKVKSLKPQQLKLPIYLK